MTGFTCLALVDHLAAHAAYAANTTASCALDGLFEEPFVDLAIAVVVESITVGIVTSGRLGSTYVSHLALHALRDALAVLTYPVATRTGLGVVLVDAPVAVVVAAVASFHRLRSTGSAGIQISG